MKKKRHHFLIQIVTAFMLNGCNGAFSDLPNLTVSWELISNTQSEDPRAKAEFVIKNNGDFTLSDNNWALYYNQRPTRTLISSRASSPVEIEWINGNWWKIYPESGFELSGGDEVTLTYEVAGWWIKEVSDAPMGLYLVVYDDKGRENEIVPIDDYQVKPFERAEQVSRHRNDPLPLLTPEARFEQAGELDLLGPDELLPVISTPVSFQSNGEYRNLSESARIFHEEYLDREAAWLADQLEALTARSIETVAGTNPGPDDLFLTTSSFDVNGIDSEAYRLNTTPGQSITISGTDEAGVFYGLQTLIGLITIDTNLEKSEEIEIMAAVTEDAPRFAYRGLFIDVARNFQSKEAIFKVLDVMAYYKLNTLHFYLTDDEGWRIEIQELPELTEVGSRRGHPTDEMNVLPPAYGSGPFPDTDGSFGSGYYTNDQFVEILRYAAERHIEVIPSINMPAHARAAIKAMEYRYQRLRDAGDEEAAEKFRLIDPDDTSEFISPQRYTDNVVNVARESVYRFYETVIDRLIKMYEEADAPLNMIHTGGDEVAEGAWAQSPLASALLDKLPDISDPQNLQTYFSNRTFDILLERDLQIGGWEEVAQKKDDDGNIVPNPEFADGDVVTYVWRNQSGTRDLAYRLANLGYPVILAHRSNFYFDLAYNNHPREPGHYSAGFINTRDAWQYAPYDIYKTTLRSRRGREIDIEAEFRNKERLQSGEEENIIGLQAQVWSETVLGQEMLEYYLLPRLAGFAESAWTQERRFETLENRSEREAEMQISWNVFSNTLAQRELPRLSKLNGGFNYRIPKPGAAIQDNRLKANTKYPGLQIRYTTNGEVPTVHSELYTGPVEISGPVNLKACDSSGRCSSTFTIDPEKENKF